MSLSGVHQGKNPALVYEDIGKVQHAPRPPAQPTAQQPGTKHPSGNGIIA